MLCKTLFSTISQNQTLHSPQNLTGIHYFNHSRINPQQGPQIHHIPCIHIQSIHFPLKLSKFPNIHSQVAFPFTT